MIITELIKQKRVYFDGGTGTVLQSMGLKAGTPPELWNIECPEKIVELHKSYLDAGCNIIKTNTFGINRDKYDNYEELIEKAIDCAKAAVGKQEEKFIAFDIGPSGRMMSPIGDMEFEEAVELFASNVRVAVKCGVDLILIETMNDSYETKAAVIAAKENSDLPIFVTNAYDESGKLMTGADPVAMITMLEGLRVDALGLNCSFGPDKMLEIIDQFRENSSTPIIVNPNAGLPRVENGKTVFDINPARFAEYMVELSDKGACILGGCCGTTPEHIRQTVEKTKNTDYKLPNKKNKTLVFSYTHSVEIGQRPVLIGERINPTGKKKLKEALRENNINYVLGEGLTQAEKGAHILDVNVGLPEIDECETMKTVVASLQAVTDLPLQLDSSDANVLEKSMRIYNGKALINSVNGKLQSMEKIFPLVRKYGGVVIALTMDEQGIPESAEERVLIAERIIEKAAEYGISKNEIVVDPLCLTVSSDNNAAKTTLKAVKLLNEKGIRTSLGVSNVSFGLPCRENINTVFFANALENGLDCAIMNPNSEKMMSVYYSFNALHGLDLGCMDYIKFASENESVQQTVAATENKASLERAIINGLKDEALSIVKELLLTEKPLDIINQKIIPALNEIGTAFEQKKAFLPQLLMSADAASGAFEIIKEKIENKDTEQSKGVILATVKGDIHDIGKNIVKVLLESYGFKVYDLGRDVEPDEVCKAVEKYNCKLVGLSALMTTTVPMMEETIRLLNSKNSDVMVMVGGAVLTQEYADMIKASFYAKDAMDAVRFAEKYYG